MFLNGLKFDRTGMIYLPLAEVWISSRFFN